MLRGMKFPTGNSGVFIECLCGGSVYMHACVDSCQVTKAISWLWEGVGSSLSRTMMNVNQLYYTNKSLLFLTHI